jgi:hypothetical protein
MGALRHGLHTVPAAPGSGVRAKAIPRTLIAERLSEALRATGTAKTALAARLGVDEAVVRRLCAGELPLSVERLVEAGRVGAVVLRAAAEEAHPMARRGTSPERHVLAVVRVAGEWPERSRTAAACSGARSS